MDYVSIQQGTYARIEKFNRAGLKETKSIELVRGQILNILGYLHDMFDADIYYLILDGGWQLTIHKSKFQFIHDYD